MQAAYPEKFLLMPPSLARSPLAARQADEGGGGSSGEAAARQRRDSDWTMARTMTFRRQTYLFFLKKLIVLAIVQSAKPSPPTKL